jgi:hypothetical protein
VFSLYRKIVVPYVDFFFYFFLDILTCQSTVRLVMKWRFAAHERMHTLCLYVSYYSQRKQRLFPIQYTPTGSSDESGALRGARNKFLYIRIED